MKRALISGISGQDGSFLAELLLGKGYQVFGIKRRTSTQSDERIKHILDQITLLDADLCDSASLCSAVKEAGPNEVYNLGAQSFVQTSFLQPELTGQVTGLGAARLIEAVKTHAPEAKFYQASSSEMFGNSPAPQNEATPFQPRSPYGIAKLYAHWMTKNYRDRGMFACSGILFNHEGSRRGREFVTQKIAYAAANIAAGKQHELLLGNLDACRDWGHAKDYVKAMWLMLQQDAPDDYVVATGESHSVRDFARVAFEHVGLDYEKYVRVDPALYRPTEINALRGDASKAARVLKWKPTTTFDELVKEMTDAAMTTVNGARKEAHA